MYIYACTWPKLRRSSDCETHFLIELKGVVEKTGHGRKIKNGENQMEFRTAGRESTTPA